MSNTMENVLFLISSIALVLLGITAIDRLRNVRLFDTSTQHVRDLLVALEDLLLPLGSFPSELLRLWAPMVPKHEPILTLSTITTIVSFDGTIPGNVHQDEAEQQQQQSSTAVVDEASVKSQAFEKALRELVDPEGNSGPDLQKLVKLVANTIKRRTEAEDKLKLETENFRRREEDRRNRWMDKEAEFERTNPGNNELRDEIEVLKDQNTTLDQKRQRKLDEYNLHLKNLDDAKKAVEESARTAETEADDRINAVKKGYEKEKSDAEFKNQQDQNSRLCKQRMILDDRNRSHLRQVEQQHQTAMGCKDKTIDRLQTKIKQMTTEAIVAEEVAAERAASDKERQKNLLEAQLKEKDSKIDTLKQQLDKSNRETSTLRQWESRAKGAESLNKRLSERLRDEKTTLREANQHNVDDLKLENHGYLRTIEIHEASISTLNGRIASLEDGEELRNLKVQLKESRKLQSTIKARDKTIIDEAKKASEAKDALKKQLEEAARIANTGLEEEARELAKQKDELSRKLETAQSENQVSRTHVQRLEEEKQRAATDHEKTIGERDGEIRRLRQVVQETKDALDAKTNEAEQTARKLEREYEEEKRKAVEEAVAKVTDEAKDQVRKLERDHEEEKKKAVEDAVGKVRDEAKDRAREHERDKQVAVEKAAREAAEKAAKEAAEKAAKEAAEKAAKEAAEKAAGEAAENVSQTHQKQLEDERQELPTNPALETQISPKPFGRQIRKPRVPQRPTQSGPAKTNLQHQHPTPTQSTEPMASVNPAKTQDQVMTDVTPKAVPENKPTPSRSSQSRSATTNLQTPPRISFADLLASVSSSKSDQSMTDVTPTRVPEKRQSDPAKTNLQGPIPTPSADVLGQSPLPGLQSEVSDPAKTNLQRPLPAPSANLLGQSPLPGLQIEVEAPTAPIAKAQSPLPGLQSEVEASTNPYPRLKLKPRGKLGKFAPQGQQPGFGNQVVNPQQGSSSSPSQQDARTDKPSKWTAEMTERATSMLRDGDEVEFVEEIIREMYDVQVVDTEGWDAWLRKLQSECEAEKKGKTEQP